jgi:hypothetical protein
MGGLAPSCRALRELTQVTSRRPSRSAFSLWAAGHAITLVTAAKVALNTIMFKGTGALAYKGQSQKVVRRALAAGSGSQTSLAA